MTEYHELSTMDRFNRIFPASRQSCDFLLGKPSTSERNHGTSRAELAEVALAEGTCPTAYSLPNAGQPI